MSSMRTSRPGKRRFNSCCDFHDRGAGRLRHDHHAVIIRDDDVALARAAGSLLPKQQAAVSAKIFMFSNLFGLSGDENLPQARLSQ